MEEMFICRWTCYRVSDHWVQRTTMAFDKWAPPNRNIPTLYTPWWEVIQFPKHSFKKLKMMVILLNNSHMHMYIRLLSSSLWHPVLCSVCNVLEKPTVSFLGHRNLLFPSLVYPTMEAVDSSKERLDTYQITWHHIQLDSHQHSDREHLAAVHC
jgi:hypothetical protein